MDATTDESLLVTRPTAHTMDAAEHMPRYSKVKSVECGGGEGAKNRVVRGGGNKIHARGPRCSALDARYCFSMDS